MNRKRLRHLGSTIAIILGILSVASSFAKIQEGQGLTGNFQSGAIMIIGALAYRSAKGRKLGEVKPTILRRVMEGLAIVLILLHFAFINKVYIQNDAYSTIVIPLWALVAYLIINLKKEKPASISNSLTK
jgi:hypothetical protein